MSSTTDSKVGDKRKFPRTIVKCPVLYQTPSSKRWLVAHLVNFSAIGICMICDDNLPVGTHLEVQIKPGSQKTVPAFSASAEVVRSETNDEQRFEISCKVIKVHR